MEEGEGQYCIGRKKTEKEEGREKHTKEWQREEVGTKTQMNEY